ERPAEALVRADDRLGKRRVDPGVGLRLERVVAATVRPRPANLLVKRPDATPHLPGRMRTAVHHRAGVIERTQQAAPRIALALRVLADAGSHGRVGYLQQQRIARG